MTMQTLKPYPQETVAELASRFSAIIRDWLSPQELAAVRLNDPSSQCCATHDFCDPNQAMLYAWEGCFGRGDVPAFILEQDDTDECYAVVNRDDQLVNAAWLLSRERGFACVS